MNFKEAKEYITTKAKKLQACSSEYKRALNAENFDELITVIRDNASWVTNEELLNNELSLKYFNISLSNLLNAGNENTGHRNSGDRNSGDWNSGDWNSGHRNSGHRNSGDWNSGHRNSGDWNSGHRNSGDWNSGDWNSGDRNSGDWNSGDWNSGDWNSGDWNSGFFNTTTPELINVFNKTCKRSEWENAEKPDFIYNVTLTSWIWFHDMTDEEKAKYPKSYVRNGYLKKNTYKEAWKNAYEKASEKDIELLKLLPNFNSQVFEEITGIKVD